MTVGFYYIYMLKCDNGHYYTGYTTDLNRRFKEHQKGTAKCKYTRSFKPLYIAQSWRIQCEKSKIMQIEKKIQRMDKKKKQELILFPEQLWTLFPVE